MYLYQTSSQCNDILRILSMIHDPEGILWDTEVLQLGKSVLFLKIMTIVCDNDDYAINHSMRW